MHGDEARDLLERIGALRHPCDLDLLVFFARHPRSLLTTESVAAFMGYDLARVAESLEVLLSAGLLTRTHTPAHAARMYVFIEEGRHQESIARLLALMSTREGRLGMRRALLERPRTHGGDPDEARMPEPFFPRANAPPRTEASSAVIGLGGRASHAGGAPERAVERGWKK